MITARAETTLDIPSEQDALRADVRRLLEAEGLSQAAAAREAGIAYSTFSAWLAGTYEGRSDKVAGDVRKWLEARTERKKASAVIVGSPGFQPTPTANEFIAAMQYAQIAVDMTVLVGGPGVGKTTALQHYAATNPNVWMVTMEPTTAKPSAMLQEICDVMEIAERSTTKLSRAIGKFVSGKQGLLAIDEGQHLSSEALDQLRSIHDRYGVGIVIAGNEAIVARLEGQKAVYAQLYSRVGVRIKRPTARVADIEAMIAAWGITDDEQVKLLRVIGRKPGALRSLDKCLRLASTLAAGGGEAISAKHIKSAWERLAPEAAA
jgi:hypothetical protein